MGSHVTNAPDGVDYWNATAGADLARMMRLAGTPEKTQAGFNHFFATQLAPALGGKPDGSGTQKGSVVGWDGSPFEYSFEFKESTKTADVRFVADVTKHRPLDAERPLSTAHGRAIIDYLAKHTPNFDSTWDRAVERNFNCEDLPTSVQQGLIDKLGFITPMILGFDIKPKMLDQFPDHPGGVAPVMLKSYYSPHYTVAHNSIQGGNWTAILDSVHNLPDIQTSPNILTALQCLVDYVADKPHYRAATRFMATDFIAPGKARLKIYMRYEGDNFDEIWDYYTLGGRIPGLESDKPMLKSLIELATGRYTTPPTGGDPARQARILTKPVAFYFSLTPDKPYPTSKVYYPPARKAPNDLVVARGITEWLDKWEYNDGKIKLEDWVQASL